MSPAGSITPGTWTREPQAPGPDTRFAVTRPQPIASRRLASERVVIPSRRSQWPITSPRTSCPRRLGLARKQVVRLCVETSVPIYNGRIDKILFVRSVTAAGHRLPERGGGAAPAHRVGRFPARRRRSSRRSPPSPLSLPGRRRRRPRCRSRAPSRPGRPREPGHLRPGLADRRLGRARPRGELPARHAPDPRLHDEARHERRRAARARADLPLHDQPARRPRRRRSGAASWRARSTCAARGIRSWPPAPTAAATCRAGRPCSPPSPGPLRARGIRLVRGPIVADEHLFDSRAHGPGLALLLLAPTSRRSRRSPTNQDFAGNGRAPTSRAPRWRRPSACGRRSRASGSPRAAG